jgi:hypothetical protein
MAQPVIQTSFNSGEWAPTLYSRVDLAKYHSAATLLRNFFVDYRGGATTRPGTRYVLKARNNAVRLIPFTASFTVTYMLEFGPGYIRFINNGSYILENPTTISGATKANPGVITDTAHGYSSGDWVFISGVGGMTQLNGNYYIIGATTANTYTLTDLFGNVVNTSTFGAYTSGGTAQRVYTILNTPYLASDLQIIKFVQDVNFLFLTHPNYPPQVLTLNAATNWTLAPITFTPTIGTPTISSITILGTAGSSTVSYVVTAVDINGQESSPSAPSQIGTVNGALTTQSITWGAVTNAVSYNVYKAIPSFSAVIPNGVPYGYIGTATGVHFTDTGFAPDFSQNAPTPANPFSGASVNNVTTTAAGSAYGSSPTPVFAAAPPGGVTALGYCYMQVVSSFVANPGQGFTAGNVYVAVGYPGVTMTVLSTTGGGFFQVATYTLTIAQSFTGPLPNSFLFNSIIATCQIGVFWGLLSVILTNPGAGYLVAPTITFTGGSGGTGAAAAATLGASSSGNPSVAALIQQRLFLGGPILSPGQFNLSQPGAPFNFNTIFPIAPDSAIQETLTSTTLHSIKSALPVSAGLVIFTDKAAWLVNGGTPGSPISATEISANPQGYSGAGDVPPIATPNDILYVQAKGSIVRDLQYNFYLNNYVGADVSILSSHLFYGYSILQWAFAEEPFKLVWALRNDGTLLSFTFNKEQELLAWTHNDTTGSYVSVATINEPTPIGNVDAVYVAVMRTINGQPVTYIERMVELTYPNDYKSSWQVDAGIGYNGAAATTFSGAQHLAGANVTGVADGVVINFVMPATGTFVFGPGGTVGLTNIANASIVTVGLAFTPQIKTLPLDLGEPTVQGKRKKITAVTLKVVNTLGLWMGRSFSSALALQDLIIGNVGSMTNTQVTGLVSGDVRGFNDPLWDVPGQYCITQPNPYPATVLGVVPEIEMGDTPK